MPILHKAVAAVFRASGTGPELLVFQHPSAGVQLPKGTVEPGESLAEATLRELEEESGLRIESAPTFLGEWTRVLDGEFGEDATGDLHIWHLHLLEAPPQVPERWRHEAIGSPEEEGLMFEFHWLAIDAELPATLHPVFGAVSAMLLAQFAS